MIANHQSVVALDGVQKSFGAQQVLRGVDLKIPHGSVVGLIGTNGSGKSTLIKCLLGLLQTTAGEATLFGEDSWNLSPECKARLSYVPQVIRLYPWMKVRDVIEYTAAFYPNWDRDWVKQLTERWEVPGDAITRTLSTGQTQKLALVLAMGHRPELMILDEPVASLDPVGRREFLRSILELTGDHERTILFSTHITSDLERVASHVAILRDGRVDYFDELDVLKDQFKRLRLRSDSPLPDSFHVEGALRCEVNSNTALVVSPRVDEPVIQQLESEWNAKVDVEDLNLEEIFVELHDA